MDRFQEHKLIHETAVINILVPIKGRVHTPRMHILDIFYVKLSGA
jgi:hypothetical protein